MIEEIKDLDSPIPEAAMACLVNLKKGLLMANKLLKMCNEGSKIYLVKQFLLKSIYNLWYGILCFLINLFVVQASELEAINIKFHAVFDKLSQALEGLALDELGISDEVTEQV